MLDADAEPQCTNASDVGDPLAQLADQLANPQVVRRVDVGQRRDVIALPSPPWHVPEIETVVDPVVHERHQVLLVDGVPHPKLGGDAAIEVAEDVEAVCALRRCRQAEQLDRIDVFEQCPIRGRCSVMELVHDHDVEMTRIECGQPRRGEALNGREHEVELLRTVRSDPQLAEARISNGVAERRSGLLEDLLAVSNKQKAGPWHGRPQAGVVDRCHDGLARACGGDQEVPVASAVSGDGDLFEQPLLKRT